jgi:hypothetical protein
MRDQPGEGFTTNAVCETRIRTRRAMTEEETKWPEPNQTCDRCGPAVRAIYHVRRQGEFFLCRHCTHRLWAALAEQGWTIWLLGERAHAATT